LKLQSKMALKFCTLLAVALGASTEKNSDSSVASNSFSDKSEFEQWATASIAIALILAGMLSIGISVRIFCQRKALMDNLADDNTASGTFAHQLALLLHLSFYSEAEQQAFKKLSMQIYNPLASVFGWNNDTDNAEIKAMAEMAASYIRNNPLCFYQKNCFRGFIGSTDWALFVSMALVTELVGNKSTPEEPLSSFQSKLLITDASLNESVQWQVQDIQQCLINYTGLATFPVESLKSIAQALISIINKMPGWCAFALMGIIDDACDVADASDINHAEETYNIIEKIKAFRLNDSSIDQIRSKAWEALYERNITVSTQDYLRGLLDSNKIKTMDQFLKQMHDASLPELDIAYLSMAAKQLGIIGQGNGFEAGIFHSLLVAAADKRQELMGDAVKHVSRFNTAKQNNSTPTPPSSPAGGNTKESTSLGKGMAPKQLF